MNRRDLVIIGFFLIWGLVLLLLPFPSDPRESTTFALISLIILVVILTVIVFASILIPGFGNWGDKKIWTQD